MLTGKKFITDTTLDVYVQDKYYEKFFIMELLNAYYSAFSILFGVAHYEFSYDSSDQEYNIYLYSCSIFSLFLIMNLFLKEKMKNEFFTLEKTLSEDEAGFLQSPQRFIKLLIQSVIILIHPNGFMKDMTYDSYNTQVKMMITRKVNELLLLVLIFRVYWIVAFLVHCTKYMDSSTNRTCRTFYFKTNLIFSIKSLIKTKPLYTIFTGFFFSVMTFAFAVRIFERGISQYTGNDFNRYWNAIWFVSITMATVGFGDFTARTNEGRSICMVACMNGVFLLSLLIIAISNFLQMNSIELNMFIISEKCKINDEVNDNAKMVITEYFHFLKKKHMFNFQKGLEHDQQKDVDKVNLLKQHTLFHNQFEKQITKTYTIAPNGAKVPSKSNTIKRNNTAFRKILFKNARKLRDRLAKFDASYNMTQNFSCENIAFNILYNNFNCIFNDLTDSLKTYAKQSEKILYIRNQLKKIADYLESEKYKEDYHIAEISREEED